MLKSANKVETNKYELEIQVSPEAFEDAIQKAYLKNKTRFTVPGFRPGKAPRKVIETNYGQEVFFEEAVNLIYGETIEEAVKEAGITLVTAPDVEVTAISKAEGVSFKAVCITKPEITVKNYKGVTVKKTVELITDEQIEHEVGHFLEKNSRSISVDDRACQNGDDVVIDFEGFKDGVPFEGGKAEKFTLTLGSGQFIPGFEDQVVGHSVGEEFDVNVTFPEEYQAEELAGAPAVFKIKLHEIKYTELPELDDDLVKDTTDFDTVDEYKADIRKKLEEEAAKRADSEVESSIMEAVIGNVEGEIPEVMYDNKVQEMIDDLSHRLSHQGLDLDTYCKFTGCTMDSLKTMYKEQAEKQVKLRLALEAIVKEEGITASDEDIEAEYKTIGEQYNMPVETVKQYIRPEDIKLDVEVGKAAELVKSSAVVE